MSDQTVLIRLAVAAMFMAAAAIGVVAFDAAAHSNGQVVPNVVGASTPEREG